ncbi:MAG TPA: glycosyltransferase [Patescibacteria group bacterium]
MQKRKKITENISLWGLRDKKYVLFSGGLSKNEGVHYLIEAFKQLEDTAKTPNNFKLVIAADGNDDEDYVKYLYFLSEGRENILFFCVRKEIFLNDLMTHAFLLAQPFENVFSQQRFERAMKKKLAILSSDSEEAKEFLENGGFFFKSKSVLDLRDRLAYLLSRNEEVRRIGELGKKVLDRRQAEEKKNGADCMNRQKLILDNHKYLWNWKNLLRKSH